MGSNIGASLIQVKAALPDANVVCFDPSSRFAPVLRRTSARNGWSGDVAIERRLLGSRAGEELELFSNEGTASAFLRDYGGYHSSARTASRRRRSTCISARTPVSRS